MSNLKDAVIAQLGCDDQDELSETLRDVANHGADAGFSGFIYYSETTEFAEMNKALIIAELKEESREFGIGLLEMVAAFNCFNGNYSVDEIAETIFGNGDDTQILNALAWYALERVAQTESFD